MLKEILKIDSSDPENRKNEMKQIGSEVTNKKETHEPSSQSKQIKKISKWININNHNKFKIQKKF